MKVQGMFEGRADIGSPIIVHVGVGQRCRAEDVESPAILPTKSARNVPAGRWMKVQGMFEGRADIGSPIIVHVGVGQRCRAEDVESPAILPTKSARNVPAGRWMKVQGMFEGRADIGSLIIVHVGVGQRCRAPDEESPAILPTMSTRNVPSWDTTLCGFNLSRGLTLVATLS